MKKFIIILNVFLSIIVFVEFMMIKEMKTNQEKNEKFVNHLMDKKN